MEVGSQDHADADGDDEAVASHLGDVKQLAVWRKAMALCHDIYVATAAFPRSELYGLAGQLRRASVAIASNLAEGRGRGTRKDYRQFCIMARGSACELETQLLLAADWVSSSLRPSRACCYRHARYYGC